MEGFKHVSAYLLEQVICNVQNIFLFGESMWLCTT